MLKSSSSYLFSLFLIPFLWSVSRLPLRVGVELPAECSLSRYDNGDAAVALDAVLGRVAYR